VTARTTTTLVVGQSGGATAVINASLVGVIAEAKESGRFGRVLGMRHGIEGLLQGDLVDLSALPASTLDRLRRTPSAALGTGRHKLAEGDLDRALERLRGVNARAVVYIGGNDSADTTHRLHHHAAGAGYDLAAVAVPKTIDNDLPETDHCPGYGSIARFLANAVRDATYDTLASPQLHPVKFVEVMGRDAGWVPAAGALAFGAGEADLAPLVLLPEHPPADLAAVLDEIAAMVSARGWAVAIVPETLRDAAGRHFGGDEPEYVVAFGHPYFASPGAALTKAVTLGLGLRARYDKPGTFARMAMALVSPVDLAEAEAAGRAAARLAAAGASDLMVTLDRIADDPYRCAVGRAPLSAVANRVRPFPAAFVGADGRSVTDAFRDYALPLLGADPWPSYARLARPGGLD